MYNRIGRSCDIFLAISFPFFFCAPSSVMLNDPFGKETPTPEWHFDSSQLSQSIEYDSA
jgi:hypothetical protein